MIPSDLETPSLSNSDTAQDSEVSDSSPQQNIQRDAFEVRAPRVAALIEVVVCSGFPTQLVLAMLLSAVGVSSASLTGDLSLSYVVALSLADAVVLIGLILFFLQRHGENPREVFLGKRPPAREVVLGLVLVPVTVILAVISLRAISILWPWLHNVPENPLEDLINSPLDAIIFVAVAIVAGGLREELQRAFILRRFEQHLGGGWFGLVIFSIVFGLGHYIQGWDAVIVTALLGSLWGASFLLRRSTVPAIVSHSGFNTSEILIAFAGASAV